MAKKSKEREEEEEQKERKYEKEKSDARMNLVALLYSSVYVLLIIQTAYISFFLLFFSHLAHQRKRTTLTAKSLLVVYQAIEES